MHSSLKSYLHQELVHIQNKLLEELELDFNHQIAVDIVKFNKNVFEHLGPMFILAFSKHQVTNKKAKNLATAVYLLLLAHNIHQDQNEFRNFNLLLGDYCFSKFYNYLCNHDLLEWSEDFSQLICQLQEAAIIKSQSKLQSLNQVEIEEIVDKDYANICSLCCYIGGSFNKLKRNILIEYKNFGLNVGRSLYLCKVGLEPNLAKVSLSQAARALTFIEDVELQQMMFKLLNHIGAKIKKTMLEVAV